MIRTFYRNGKGNYTTDLPLTHWKVALHDAGGLFWMDFNEEAVATVEPHLRDTFHFHALAIDDALNEAHVPKIDNWGEYVYAVAHGVVFDEISLELGTRELDIFLGRNFLVTYHKRDIAAIHRVWDNTQIDQRRLEGGPDHLLYEILDHLTADYLPAIDALDATIDELEDEVFERPSTHTLNTIFAVKRAVLNLRRIIGPQREVLNKLARDEYAMIDAKDRVYFRDVYDHLVRLVDLNENLRDLTSGTLDTYLSVTSNRTNEIMKVLTIISALFMPISFMAGFFGMNFIGIPFDRSWLLAGAMVMMGITPVLMFLWFKRQGWL